MLARVLDFPCEGKNLCRRFFRVRLPIWGPVCVPVGMSPPPSIPSFVMFHYLRRRRPGSRATCVRWWRVRILLVDYARELGVRGALFSWFAAAACFSCLNQRDRRFCAASPATPPGRPPPMPATDARHRCPPPTPASDARKKPRLEPEPAGDARGRSRIPLETPMAKSGRNADWSVSCVTRGDPPQVCTSARQHVASHRARRSAGDSGVKCEGR